MHPYGPNAVGKATAVDMDNLSGLDKLQATLGGNAAPSGFDRSLQLRLLEAERGRVSLSAPATPDHANASGVMHGGWIAGVLDAASGAATQSLLNPGEAYTTLTLQVNYLKAVPASGDARAEGRVIRGGGRVVTAEATVSIDGEVRAIATATCLRLPPRAR